jgi:hypothetical protein
MTLEEKLHAALFTLCPRTFTDFAPFDTTRPYVTYQQIGGDAVAFQDGAVASKENALVQINVWSDTRKEAKALILQIEAALSQSNAFQACAQGAAFNDFDVDMRRYGSLQTFSVWADR